MSQKVLFVDDDQKVLNGISRQFEDVLEFETAIGPGEALELLEHDGPFAVVVADMRMPGMNGVELLSRVKDKSPDTVRIMLTGFADFQVTVEAVNEGNIFRFLSKPCSKELLAKTVQDGLAQHRLITAERELLEGTLHGSISVLCEMLSLVNPLAFGRTTQVQRIAVAIGEQMKIPNPWELKIASMLFPLGCVTVSEVALECLLTGRPIPESEKAVFERHSSLARGMLEKIPRLESVAEIIGYQDKSFDGGGLPDDQISGEEIPTGARILKVASDFEIFYKRTGDTKQAFEGLINQTGQYDPLVLASLETALRNGLCQASKKEVSVRELTTEMVLAADVRGIKAGQLVIASGQKITETIKQRLIGFCENELIQDKFSIEVLEGINSLEPSHA